MSNIAPRITYPSYKRPNPEKETAHQTDIDPSEMAGLYRLYVECPITRRKRFSQIVTPDGETVFSDRSFGACLLWLEAEGVHRYILETETHQFLIRLELLEGNRRIS